MLRHDAELVRAGDPRKGGDQRTAAVDADLCAVRFDLDRLADQRERHRVPVVGEADQLVAGDDAANAHSERERQFVGGAMGAHIRDGEQGQEVAPDVLDARLDLALGLGE